MLRHRFNCQDFFHVECFADDYVNRFKNEQQ